MYLSTKYMINRGHTHIAFVASYEGGLAAGKKIAAEANKISAVATIADICAIGIMEGTRLGDLRIPVDLSIVGYDNLSLCQFTTPKLTSVSQNISKKARVATGILLEKIQTDSKTPCVATLNVEIVERQSVISLF